MCSRTNVWLVARSFFNAAELLRIAMPPRHANKFTSHAWCRPLKLMSRPLLLKILNMHRLSSGKAGEPPRHSSRCCAFRVRCFRQLTQPMLIRCEPSGCSASPPLTLPFRLLKARLLRRRMWSPAPMILSPFWGTTAGGHVSGHAGVFQIYGLASYTMSVVRTFLQWFSS